MALRNRQLVFCEGYLRTWNATQAAKDAGYSPRTARAMGCENLTKPDIQAYIQKRLAEMKMSADEVLLLLADQARASLKPFVRITDEGFMYFDFSQPEALNHLHLIKKVRSKRTRRIQAGQEWEDEVVEVELHDSQVALKLLGQHHKLFTEEMDMQVGLNIEGFEAALNKAYGQQADANIIGQEMPDVKVIGQENQAGVKVIGFEDVLAKVYGKEGKNSP